MEATSLRPQPSPSGTRLWAWVRAQLDLAQYRPQAAPDVVVSRLMGRDGPYYVIKNPATRTYYRLSERDYFLWERMDGTQSVKDLVVAYFLAHGSFAFARIAGLVAGLKANQFLVDQPVYVYQQAREQLQRRSLSHRLGSLWQSFLQKQFAISGIDGFVSTVYRHGGWLLFTRIFLLFSVLIAIVGLVLYVRLFGSGTYSLVSAQGSVGLGLVTLIVANLLSIFMHEMSHALTVKHYGREVRRAGFMIYFGLPAFFVDTTDIWLEGKRARMAVTWAGPWSGLVLAGLAAVILTVWSDLPVNDLLYQFAFLAYLTVFVNLNPLLELDGYYLLMDWLEIPMLRRKSMDFLGNGLRARWKAIVEQAGRWSPGLVIGSLSREERIFVVFGFLSALWTSYAIFVGISFWQRRLAGSLASLTNQEGNVSGVLLALLGVAISVAFIVAVGTYPVTLARRAAKWSRRRGLFANLRLVTLLLVGLAVILALVPALLDRPTLNQVAGLAGLALAAGLAWRNATHFSGSRLGHSFRLLALFALALFVAEALRGLLSLIDMSVPADGSFAGVSLGALGLEVLAFGALLGSGLVLLGGVDLRGLSLGEKLVLLAGWAASYIVTVLVVRGLTTSAISLMPALVWTVAPLLTLACLIPTLFAFQRTGFGPGWLVLALALVALVVAGLAGRPSFPLPWLLLASAGYLHLLAYRRLGHRRGQPEDPNITSDRVRLQRAFTWTIISLVGQFREIAGQGQANKLVERFNSHALAAGWEIRIRDQQVSDSLPQDLSLIARGQAYAAALTLLLDETSREVGETLVIQALQQAYDGLAWEEREIGNQYLFRHVARAEALSQAFQAAREDYASLLRQMPLFSTMTAEELDLLVSRLRLERYRPREDIVRQGEPGDDFYIISSGQVEVIVRDEHGAADIVNRLSRGDYFGELALLQDSMRTATCRTIGSTEVLALSREDFDRLVRERFDLRDKLDTSIARANLLRRLPLFSELDGLQIQHVVAQMQEEHHQPGDLIIQQGNVGDSFYVIEAGRVQIFTTENGQRRVLRESGAGEYFGEIALLQEVPRTASVRALAPTRLLVLRKEDFDVLVAEHLYLSRALELESSRRLIHSRRSAVPA